MQALPNNQHLAPIEGILGAEETVSALRYCALAPAEGATPARGQEVELSSMPWNA